MSVIPSGSRRKMEAQNYMSDLSASSVLNNLFTKVADTSTLDRPEEEAAIAPNPELANKDMSANPREIPQGIDKAAPEAIKEPGMKPNVNDVMNQSNTLPGKATDIMVVDINGAVREDEQGKLAGQILKLLAEKGFTRPGTFVLKRFDLSNGIELSAIPKSGPAITKG